MTNLARKTPNSGGISGIVQSGLETAVQLEIVTSDGVSHPTRYWAGAIGSPVAVYLHGIEGHSRWFEGTAVALNKSGIGVYAPDRRGAGASRERRGHIASYKRLVDDLAEIVAEVERRHPSSPLFLIGNCWGGKLALTLAGRDNGRLVRGIVLTSPAVSTQVDAPPLTKIKIGLSYLLGGGSYFDIPLTPEHFTDNPPYLEYVANDPLRLREATASFFVQSLLLTRACRKAAAELRIPLLILQSGRDAIVNLDATQQWFQALPTMDKTLKIFTTAAHSLDFEPDQTEYQSLLADWINSRAFGAGHSTRTTQ